MFHLSFTLIIFASYRSISSVLQIINDSATMGANYTCYDDCGVAIAIVFITIITTSFSWISTVLPLFIIPIM
jgi:hypothetical protein